MQNQILNGNIFKTTIKLSIPVLIGQLLMIGYNIADTIFISFIDRTSKTLMSGLGLIFPLFFLYIAVGSGLFSGISSLVARSIGAKDEKVLSRVADSGLFFSLILALISIVIAYSFYSPIINLFAGSKISAEAIGHAKSYFLFIAPGLSMLLIQMTLLGILQGEGKSQHYGISMTISTLLNLILDPIFIFVLDFGVQGAALASTISISMSLLYILTVFLRQKSDLRIHWNIFKAKFSIIMETLRIGIPHTASMIVLSISFMALNRLVGSISEVAMSGWVIYGRMNELIMMPGYAVGNAAMTMVGQNYGSKNYSRVVEIVKSTLKTVLILSLVAALMMNIAAPFLFRLFSEVPEIIELCILQARITGLSSITVAGIIVVGSSFQGAGRALPGFTLTFCKMFLVFVPISIFLIKYMELGLQELIYAGSVSNIIFFGIGAFWVITHFKKLAKQNI